ncbi:MAG: RNA polymerase, sigma-24 subunit, ECF subfamily [Candidatus Falkowbacteria bacterium GW2011_GWC2_38_22]|uniref:RNA polymerase, sigma-24 subunit, ECF subfamily n=1 Tax=Candidatus Falkowbacteria bacterium GW2011_GWE1_38_31 TaxID=1618638 RepID=A0A0G0JTE6_9BACT|nr:MAG: RNA polymerase, sigma-24 subunit, ECF subfamily [Candidatus Falkowbacteria bacterium GW2011_GWF2_38_1205]KKQ61945.1 MAG: RNA polymerase, sigma-24 subunit, ECF subfamily [Candidatus Falkowbacteria bacterium GW2011_GWC2_38_22]KKQ63893.1 MAG: RNA polymerase, sigma-24 subunit, ECF subfamily [Candidatus Falkowbacteria bacterium GW2011_GWF1_38_22]KKQ66150.1 MAG: RNA polymerase, sigma-24 subunit, ECF subfamily [Candidatus Falkowbacteria bacterium GW2011_GWE2_38_254]KKQ70753.1 MAG: RNA polymera
MPENSNIEEKSDEELVGLAIKDQAVFLHIMNRYQAKLLYYIKRISGLSNDEAEDVLQDVFIKIYQNLNDFDIDLKFSSWAYRITHNQVISNFRKIQARPQNAGIDLNDDSLRGLAADLDIEGKIDNSLLREKINKILNNLEYKYKEVLILKFFEEKDYKEISDILKKPMGTVASLMNRAKIKFREEMDRRDSLEIK